MDNWVVTPEERKVFESQFRSLKPIDGNITGENARGFFLQSGLPGNILAFIWELSDVTRDGRLNIAEFIVACKLIQMKLRGNNIPPVLPPPLLGLISNPVDIQILPIASSPIAVTPVAAGVAAPPPTPSAAIAPTTLDLQDASYEWSVPYNTKLKYTQMFNQADKTRTGFLTGVQARGILVLTQLPIDMLAKVWALADLDGDGQLTCEEFVLAMYLCDLVKSGKDLPSPLPPDLIPPTFVKKKQRQNSVSSTGSADLPIMSTSPPSVFEDKRKENFEKGQAELERRRQALLEVQRQEKEERERKEREEEERKEKLRLEQEKRRQEEMEKQLQKQREIEMEKEKQRRIASEQKEAARKELERQRHLEWEKQKLQELEITRNKTIDVVRALKEKYRILDMEYQSLCNKVREITQQTGETRNGVSAVKATIDGMRTTRDALQSELTQLKNQLKEQNQRLIMLNQEKSNLEHKFKPETLAANAKLQEQMKLDAANQRLTLDKLEDSVKDYEKKVEEKKVDLNNNIATLLDMKNEVSAIIGECEQLYSDYIEKKNEVLKLKSAKIEESWSNAAWDEAPATTKWTTDYETTKPKRYRALFEFVARNSDEISFQPGDIIVGTGVQNVEPGWLSGEIRGSTGWFPESYVEEITEQADNFNNNAMPTSNAILEQPLEDIVEVPENVSDSGSALEESGPVVQENMCPMVGAGESVNLKVQALYSWVAKDVNQLSFKKEDVIEVSRKDSNWYYGTVQGTSGWFPVQYVKVISSADLEEYCTALYQYKSSEPGDLCFEQNDVIKVIKKDGVWWTGVLNGVTGMFPSNYVQKTTTPVMSPVKEMNHTPRCASAPPTQLESQRFDTMRSVTPDFTSFQEKAKKPEIATVIAPYQATSKEQLSLHRGQLIMIRKKTTSGWWEGESHVRGKKRQVGWFPASYVKVIGSGSQTPVANEMMNKEPELERKKEPDTSQRVVALFKYTALNADELSFEKDDVIRMISKEEPDWWKGELNGTVGLFPSNYVQPL